MVSKEAVQDIKGVPWDLEDAEDTTAVIFPDEKPDENLTPLPVPRPEALFPGA